MASLKHLTILGLAALSAAMPLNSDLEDIYDYIVIGGGAGGLTVANRLTENPNITVLVLEAGYADSYEEKIQVPVMQGSAGTSPFYWCGQYNWCQVTTNQTYLDGKPRNVPQGYGLGGGTLINAMLWNRGDRGDYDDWETLGNDGWGWDDMLPYFEKSETFNPEMKTYDASYYGVGEDASVHGFEGPQPVAFPNWYYNVSQNFFAALNALGVPTSLDPNDGLTKGAMYLPQGINATNQTRADARRQRYDPVALRPNLYVSTRQQVTRILWEGGCNVPSGNQRAVGVEFAPNPDSIRSNVAARREIIVSGGAVHTPALLELSGIGSTDVLSNIEIAQRVNLPGVGNNLQDHMLLRTYTWLFNTSYIYPNFLNNETNNDAAKALYYHNKTGPWTNGPPDGNAFLALAQFSNRTSDLQSMANSQDAAQYLAPNLDSTVVAGFNKMKSLLANSLSDNTRAAIEMLNDNGGQIQISNMRPFTRGSVHAISSDPFVHPALDFRYGSNPVDLEVLVDALFFKHQIWLQPSMSILVPDEVIPYSFANRTDLLNFINTTAATEFHPSGSAAMLPKELGGVVDNNLLVYGTSNLRIVDASITPITPASHLEAVVYGIAEKASDIIKAAQANGYDAPQDPTLPLDTASCTASTTSYAASKRAVSAGGSATSPMSRPITPTPEPTSEPPYVVGYPYADHHDIFDIPQSILDTAANEGEPKGAGLLWAVDNGLAGLLNGVGGLVGGIL